jgi:hypothetical protein
MRRFEQGVDRLAGKFSSMLDEGADQGASFGQLVGQGTPPSSFGGMVGQGRGGAPTFGQLGRGAGAPLSFGNLAANGGARGFDTSWLTRLNDVREANNPIKLNPDGTYSTGSKVGEGRGGASAGLAPNVAQVGGSDDADLRGSARPRHHAGDHDQRERRRPQGLQQGRRRLGALPAAAPGQQRPQRAVPGRARARRGEGGGDQQGVCRQRPQPGRADPGARLRARLGGPLRLRRPGG